jgi:CBS domain-containing protein
MRVADIMSKQLVTLMPGHSVRHAAQIMLEHGVSGLPVIDVDKLVGILTEGDLLRRVELSTEGNRSRISLSTTGTARDFVRTHSWRVSDVMSSPVVTVDEDMPLTDAAVILSTRGIKRVPVLREGVLVGILSRADLLKIIAQSRPDKIAEGDDALRRAAQARLGELGLFSVPPLVTVEDHVVHLWGVVKSEAERDAARVAVERIPGLLGLENHLKVGDHSIAAPATR